MSRRPPGGCWPTPHDELLLTAALGDGDAACAAYAVWRAVTNLDRPCAGTFRLLPLLGKNLKRLGVKDDRSALFHGIYRKTWAQNQLLFRELSGALSALSQVEIPTLVLKGAALSINFYRDLGARPMSDGDILVPPEHAAFAVETLRNAGWHSQCTPLDGLRAQKLLERLGVTLRPREDVQCSAVFRGVRHAHSFAKPGIAELDLHWRISEKIVSTETNFEIWRHAVPIEVCGVKSLAMDATDQLLHVIAHGVRWNVVPPWRWVADAAMILKAAASEGETEHRIDWPRLVAQADALCVALPLAAGLAYLAQRFALPIPQAVIAQLAALSTPLGARCEYHLKLQPAGVVAGLFELGYLGRRYLQMAGRPEYPQASRGPLHFLQHVLGIDHLWQVGLYSAVELLRRSHATIIRLR